MATDTTPAARPVTPQGIPVVNQKTSSPSAPSCHNDRVDSHVFGSGKFGVSDNSHYQVCFQNIALHYRSYCTWNAN